MACSFGMPNSTALRIQSYRFVAEPAIVPSARRATLFFRNTSCPPSVYCPSGIPQQRSASEMRQILPGKSLKAMRTALGWTCWPSQISSAATASRSLPAPMGPGLRWWMPGMALYRCVRWLAPASKTAEASSYVQSVCAMETVQSLLASFVNSTAPGSSAATSAMRMRPSDTS